LINNETISSDFPVSFSSRISLISVRVAEPSDCAEKASPL